MMNSTEAASHNVPNWCSFTQWIQCAQPVQVCMMNSTEAASHDEFNWCTLTWWTQLVHLDMMNSTGALWHDELNWCTLTWWTQLRQLRMMYSTGAASHELDWRSFIWWNLLYDFFICVWIYMFSGISDNFWCEITSWALKHKLNSYIIHILFLLCQVPVVTGAIAFFNCVTSST